MFSINVMQHRDLEFARVFDRVQIWGVGPVVSWFLKIFPYFPWLQHASWIYPFSLHSSHQHLSVSFKTIQVFFLLWTLWRSGSTFLFALPPDLLFVWLLKQFLHQCMVVINCFLLVVNLFLLPKNQLCNIIGSSCHTGIGLVFVRGARSWWLCYFNILFIRFII